MNRLLKDLPFTVYTTPLEKTGSSGERRLIRGYASVGDVLDRQNEVITLGALMKAREDLLKNHTIFYEHKHSELPIGKTIAVDVDERGLLITVELSKGEHADSVWTLIQEGILDSFSIGGRVLEAEEKRDDDGNLFNEITRIELFETSIVGLPANPAAKFELLSKGFRKAITEEMKKREVSNKMAKENKETEKEVEKKNVDKSEDTSEKTQEKEIEKTEEKEVEKSEESTEEKDTKKDTEEVKKSDEAKEEKSEEKEKGSEKKETEKTEEKSEEKEEDKVEKAHTNNATDEVNLHWHEAAVDEKGNGETTTIVTKEGYSGDANHVHAVVDGEVQEVDGHPHALIAPVETSTETETEKSKEEKSDETNSLEEKSSDKEPKEEKEPKVEEKSIEEKILEKMAEILEEFKAKKEAKKSEEKSEEKETSKENTEEAPVETAKSEDKVEVKKSEDTSEKSEDVSEEKKDTKETKPEKENIEKVVKTKDTPKEEEKSEEKETPARKGEAIIAQTPYATEGEEKIIDKDALRKARDEAWCKIVFDK